jgi:hypothetical protein
MRFAIVAASLMALVAAESTVYATEEITITSCAPTVTDCPARSTVVSTTSYPVVTPVETYPAATYPAETATYPVSSASVSVPVYANSTWAAPTTYVAATYPASTSTYAAVTTPAVSLSTITISTCKLHPKPS